MIPEFVFIILGFLGLFLTAVWSIGESYKAGLVGIALIAIAGFTIMFHYDTYTAIIVRDEYLPVTVEIAPDGSKRSVVEYVDMIQPQSKRLTTYNKHYFDGLIDADKVNVVQSYRMSMFVYSTIEATFIPVLNKSPPGA